ncbi:MAG: NUDIX domain-containing protein [Gammaproteobacteria bacterium]|nr:NUDIX domain-containing protein [Gammaproteobacteria bacterium]
MNKSRFKLVPAVYLILIQDQKILMLQRYNTGYEDGKYSLVAGHVESKETFRQAMVREAKEEAGIILPFEHLKVVHVMHRYEPSDPSYIAERIDAFIQTEQWKGELKNQEPHKCNDLGWFPLNDLPRNTIPYVEYAIRNIQQNIFYSEWGFYSISN